MERYNGILCISASELIDGGFISQSAYKVQCYRGNIIRVRRACRDTPALVDVLSLPSKILAKVKEKYGTDLEKSADKNYVMSRYVLDQEAYQFYRDYMFEGVRHLEEKYIHEYSTNASVLKLTRILANERIAYVATRSNARPSGLWQDMSSRVNACRIELGHTLPENYRRLKTKLDEFEAKGYECLISGKFGNKNTEKINDDARLWILSRWADRVNKVTGITQMFREYNEKAREMDWAILKTEKTIYNFLYEPEIRSIWMAHRHGELIAKEHLCYQHKTLLPTMRDSLWYSDGTKMNYYFKYYDKAGKLQMGTTNVYEVMDAYSEVFLGYHISERENYQQQRAAYKMALEVSGHKPYQIKYDNQGGHKKLKSNDFLNSITHLAISTMPYNGKSKTIEAAFGRFQKEYLAKDMCFTGMNITATSLESRANMEFILANPANLPTLEEAQALYVQRRTQWNNAEHPKYKGKTRMEVYMLSQNPQAVAVSKLDFVDIFWVTREKPITCNAYGLSFTENKIKYDYMVMSDNLPDMDWLSKNIDKKFTVKFDPDDTSSIALYEETANGLRFVSFASTKVAIHRGIQEQEEWEAQFIKDVELANKAKRVERVGKIDTILALHGALPEQQGYNSPKIAGVTNGKHKNAEAASIGAYNKMVSNAVYTTEQEKFDPQEYAFKNQ